MKVKFRECYSVKSTLKNKEFYEFDISEKDIANAKIHTFDNPYFIAKGLQTIGLYYEKNQLCLWFATGYSVFEEGLGIHGLKKKFDNAVTCKCGKTFFDKAIPAEKQLKSHIKRMKELTNATTDT